MRLRRILVALGALALAVPPAAAAPDPLVHPDQFVPDSAAISPITAAFVAAVGPFNGFLEAADRLAATRVGRGRRSVAAREAAACQAVLDALRAWSAGIARARYAEAHAPTIDRLGPVFGLVGGPVDVVAVPADLAQRRDIAALAQLEGEPFDALYTRAQTGTLLQLEAIYVDYIKNGDDQVLRALSVRDLGRVRARLALLPGR